jgi:hypothetical protein
MFSHWYAIVAKGSERSAKPHELLGRTMEFLISSDWTFGEARDRGIRLSKVAVRRQFNREKRANFKTREAFRRFLRRTGQTVGDVELRVRLDMLSERILKSGVGRFATKWRGRTSCLDGYSVSECGSMVPAGQSAP